MDYMQERLKAMKKRLQDIDEILSKGEGDYKVLAQLSKERSSLATPVEMYESIQSMEKNIQEEKEMLKDPDLEIREMARLDILSLEEKIEKTKKDLQVELLPKDANDDKNVIMEIRGAAGGDEANIFAGDLFRMYEHYADKKGWKIKVLDSQMTALGGYSLVSFMVEGKGVYSRLKFESGAHRVQRVPVTEANGRIQTSTATVLVMPEIEKVDIEINPADLEIDTYHSSGAGGQNVNKTESAVRITHKSASPTSRRGSSSPARSREARCRTRRWPWRCSGPSSRANTNRSRRRRSETSAVSRSERARGTNGSGRTTIPRTG